MEGLGLGLGLNCLVLTALAAVLIGLGGLVRVCNLGILAEDGDEGFLRRSCRMLVQSERGFLLDLKADFLCSASIVVDFLLVT